MRPILLFTLILLVLTQIEDDLVQNPPGMPQSPNMYSGYLDTLSPTRKLHYVFVESESNPETDPVVLWLNGGPGCSSLLGFLQEIGTYTLETKYVNSSNLTKNPYAWTKAANILYLESPAGVGFSINTDRDYHHNDSTTAADNYAAIRNFFEKKGSKWVKNQFFITGESYAGKYIPDLVTRIFAYNAQFYINIIGIMVGNGVMNFQDHELDISSILYMNSHNFLDPTLMSIFEESCVHDYFAPRCSLFRSHYYKVVDRLNPYNVYETCKPSSSQVLTLMKSLGRVPKDYKFEELSQSLNALKQCSTQQGMIDYLNQHRQKYNIKQNIHWHSCNGLLYSRTPHGSMAEYRTILLNGKIRVWLYNGDADSVVPFTDTLRNLPQIGVYPQDTWNPWYVGENHAGFYQYYSKMTIITVKAAGHMVPQDKRKQAYQMFYNFIKDRPINTPVS